MQAGAAMHEGNGRGSPFAHDPTLVDAGIFSAEGAGKAGGPPGHLGAFLAREIIPRAESAPPAMNNLADLDILLQSAQLLGFDAPPAAAPGTNGDVPHAAGVPAKHHAGDPGAGGGPGSPDKDTELRTHPQYANYYQRHRLLNPRLPPPLRNGASPLGAGATGSQDAADAQAVKPTDKTVHPTVPTDAALQHLADAAVEPPLRVPTPVEAAGLVGSHLRNAARADGGSLHASSHGSGASTDTAPPGWSQGYGAADRRGPRSKRGPSGLAAQSATHRAQAAATAPTWAGNASHVPSTGYGMVGPVLGGAAAQHHAGYVGGAGLAHGAVPGYGSPAPAALMPVVYHPAPQQQGMHAAAAAAAAYQGAAGARAAYALPPGMVHPAASAAWQGQWAAAPAGVPAGFPHVPGGGLGMPDARPRAGGRGRGGRVGAGAHGGRSGPYRTAAEALIAEIRASKGKRTDPWSVVGSAYDVATDQHGSRFLQQKLDSGDHALIEALLAELLPRMVELMSDVFGNYVAQKLMEHGSEAVRRELHGTFEGRVVELSRQTYACRVVQRALETFGRAGRLAVAAEVAPDALALSQDQNGNHVVQKCIECLEPADLDPLLARLNGRAGDLAVHAYGCRVVQRVLERCSPKQLRDGRFLEDPLQRIAELCEDQYGNYVMQHVLRYGDDDDRRRVAEHVAADAARMSRHKFASNVVEKALELIPEREPVDSIVDAILQAGPAEDAPDRDRLVTLCSNQYANYVVQQLVNRCDPERLHQVQSRLVPALQELHACPYGRHIAARLDTDGGAGPAWPARGGRAGQTARVARA